MKFIPIINKNCNLCGECINVCPKNHIAKDTNSVKITVDECMLCAHCFSVCKHNAISFDPSVLKEIEFKHIKYHKSNIKIDHENLINTFRTRRSIRKYKDTIITKDLLRDLVEFATTAPSGSNCQYWEFSILESHEKVSTLAQHIQVFFEKINKLAKNPFIRYFSYPFTRGVLHKYYKNNYNSVELALKEAKAGKDLLFHGAPAVIIIHSRTNGSTPCEDAQYAAYNIALLAHTLELGTCYIGYAVEAINRDKKTKKYLGIPEENKVYSVITLGYCDVKFSQMALRKPYQLHFL